MTRLSAKGMDGTKVHRHRFKRPVMEGMLFDIVTGTREVRDAWGLFYGNREEGLNV